MEEICAVVPSVCVACSLEGGKAEGKEVTREEVYMVRRHENASD